MLIYFDNAATTRPKYTDTVDLHCQNGWFNPSAAYSAAADVFVQIKAVRQKILDKTGFDGSAVFTSGGTEANNLAIRSAYKKAAHYITSAVEHPSVYEVFKSMEQEGAKVDYIKPKGFCIRPEEVAEKVRDDTKLVSIMHVNNETGALNDIRAIAAAVKAKNKSCLFHSDGVQALKKTGVNLAGNGVDLYSISAHKIHAFKGTGALLVKNGVQLKPLLLGGGQENKIRPGTENTLGIQALGAALEDKGNDTDKITGLRQRLIDGLESINGAVINVPAAFVPHIVSVSIEGVRAEVLVRLLGEKGIYVGTGAACAKGKLSRVLLECGVERSLAEGTVRISMSKDNTENEIDILLEELNKALETLRRFGRN